MHHICIVDRFSKLLVIYRGEDSVFIFIDAMLREEIYCREVIDKHFNKNLVMNEDDEKDFIEFNKCRICGRLYAEKDTRVRYHNQGTSKDKGSEHKTFNTNFKLSKKVPPLFHNFRGYNSHSSNNARDWKV